HDDYRALEDAAVPESVPDAGQVSFRREIRLDGVSYSYPRSGRAALHDVSVSIRHGESIGIVGHTGAGKSTVVDLVLGLLKPASGTITVDGVALTDEARWRRRVGYVPQTLFLIDDTLRRNIALGIRDDAIDERRVLDVLRMSQLARFIAELPQGLDT